MSRESTCWSGEPDYVERLEADNARLRTIIRDLLWAIGHNNEQVLNETTAQAKAALEPKP